MNRLLYQRSARNKFDVTISEMIVDVIIENWYIFIKTLMLEDAASDSNALKTGRDGNNL